MSFFNKKIILKNPIRYTKFKNELLKGNKNTHQRNELSLSNINYQNNEPDRDKITLENINYLKRDIFKKKSLFKQNSFYSKKNNYSKKELNHPLLINKDNLFGNKLIRNLNKIKNIQINIFEQEISMKKLLTTKRMKMIENKYQVIKDDKNNINNKNKILNIIRTQTKSNFNNKYRLMFKSSNKKKRNVIQNYFSLIKRDIKYNYDQINSTRRNNYSKDINYPELSFRSKSKLKINKDILNNINYSHITEKKKKLIFIPILNPNSTKTEISKIIK